METKIKWKTKTNKIEKKKKRKKWAYVASVCFRFSFLFCMFVFIICLETNFCLRFFVFILQFNFFPIMHIRFFFHYLLSKCIWCVVARDRCGRGHPFQRGGLQFESKIFIPKSGGKIFPPLKLHCYSCPKCGSLTFDAKDRTTRY